MKKLIWLAFLLPFAAQATWNNQETRTDLEIIEDHGTSTGWFGCSRKPSSSSCAKSRVVIDHEDRISANKAKSRQNMMGVQQNARVNRSQQGQINHNHSLGHRNERVNAYQQYRIERNSYGIYRNRQGVRDNAAAISQLQNDTVMNAQDISDLQAETKELGARLSGVGAMVAAMGQLHFDVTSDKLQFGIGYGIADMGNYQDAIAFGLAKRVHDGLLFSASAAINHNDRILGVGASWEFK